MTPSMLIAAANPLDHVLPHPVFEVGGFVVTNHLVMGTVAAVLVLLTFLWFAGRMKRTGTDAESFVTKGTFTQLLETMCEFILENVARPNLKHLTEKYIPYIWTVFFFILTCNLLGMIPFGYFFKLVAQLAGSENASYWGHFGGTATSNLSLNAPLALCSFIAVLYIGIKETGFKHFVMHFNPLGWGDPKMLPIGIMLFLLEWLGLVIKCIVLAVRLFGTMLAGHLVLAALVGMIFIFGEMYAVVGYGVGLGVVVLNTVLSILELFIAFLQAFIFTYLTTLFIALTAVTDHGEHGHDELEHEHEVSREETEVAKAALIP